MGLDKEDIKQLIAILQKGLSDDNSENIPEENHTKPQTQKTKKTGKPKKPNLFDKMAEFKMHKEDVEIDKRLRKQPPTERSRNYQTVNVKCRVCGKNETINPSLVESVERYKCNKCCTSPG